MNRFQIFDDIGLIRTFLTKEMANNYLKNKPEFKLKVIPKEKVIPLNFDELDDCLL